MHDGYYGGRRQSPIIYIVGAIIFVVILVGGVIMYVLNRNKPIVSPVPPKPSLEIIFYTPTPEMASPTSSPSATPKLTPTGKAVKLKPSPTPEEKPSPTGKVSPTPTGRVSSTPSPTSKVTPSTTPKPTTA